MLVPIVFQVCLDSVREGDSQPHLAEIPAFRPKREGAPRCLRPLQATSPSPAPARCAGTGWPSAWSTRPFAPPPTSSPVLAAPALNPNAVLRQMKRSMTRARVEHHTHALVLMVAHPRDPSADEPGARSGSSACRTGGCAARAETAAVLANYPRILGHEARSHTATTTDVHQLLAVPLAGAADGRHQPLRGHALSAWPWSPPRSRSSPTSPGPGHLNDADSARGLSWWLGASSRRTPPTRSSPSATTATACTRWKRSSG